MGGLVSDIFDPPPSPQEVGFKWVGGIYGDGDTLHWQKAPHIWQWGHFALAKSPSYMAMGTLCTARKPLIYGNGDSLHCQKVGGGGVRTKN